MSEYVRDIIVKKRFQNDDVTIVLSPVKFSDALKFAGLDTKSLKAEQLVPMMGDMKGYVKTLSGLKARDASAVTIDEFFELAYFVELLTDVLSEWIERSTPENPPSAGALPTG